MMRFHLPPRYFFWKDRVVTSLLFIKLHNKISGMGTSDGEVGHKKGTPQLKNRDVRCMIQMKFLDLP